MALLKLCVIKYFIIMLKSILNLNGVNLLPKEQQASINGGDRVWTVTCNDGTQFCLNNDGAYTPQAIVALCNNYGGFNRQSMEPEAKSGLGLSQG